MVVLMVISESSASLLFSSSVRPSSSSCSIFAPPSPRSSLLCVMNSSAVLSIASHTPGPSSSTYPARSSSGAPAVHSWSKPSSDPASSCTASATAWRTASSASRGSLPLIGWSIAGRSVAPPSVSSAGTPFFLSMQMFFNMVAIDRLRSTTFDWSWGMRCWRKWESAWSSSSRPSGKRHTCGSTAGRCRSWYWSSSQSSPVLPWPMMSPMVCAR
mmetsp:Transcript_1332/g.2664  ORF Transcript_1332/g.2664 Transcript_1332/m.2664 type:complete len:214 (-) Transcript_1332:561-1202(-)